MAIKIVVSDIVGFKVKVSINDAAGNAQAFTFGLKCKRLTSEELQELNGIVYADFMAGVILDWSDVQDAQDKPLPYSESAWRELCKIPGLGAVAFRTYLGEVGAKEKN